MTRRVGRKPRVWPFFRNSLKIQTLRGSRNLMGKFTTLVLEFILINSLNFGFNFLPNLGPESSQERSRSHLSLNHGCDILFDRCWEHLGTNCAVLSAKLKAKLTKFSLPQRSLSGNTAALKGLGVSGVSTFGQSFPGWFEPKNRGGWGFLNRAWASRFLAIAALAESLQIWWPGQLMTMTMMMIMIVFLFVCVICICN